MAKHRLNVTRTWAGVCLSALCTATFALAIPAGAASAHTAPAAATSAHTAVGRIHTQIPLAPADDPSEDSTDKSTGAPQGENLDQRVEQHEAFDGDTQVVLAAHHVDLGPRIVDGKLALQVRDDTQFPPTWRPLEKVVIKVADAALMQVPDSPDYDFLSFAAGKQAWVIPQVEVPGVVWLGWSTQHPTITENAQLGVTFDYQGVQGPGQMALFLQPGNFQPPQLLFSSVQEKAQPVWVELNTHTHANWVFSAPGNYLVKVIMKAKLIDGSEVETPQYLRFAVGDDTDEQAAFSLAWDSSDDAAGSAGGDGGASGAGSAGGAAGAGGDGSDGGADAQGSDPAADEGEATGAGAGEPGDDSAAESSLPTAAIIGIGALALAALAAGVALSSRRRQAMARALLEKEKSAKQENHD